MTSYDDTNRPSFARVLNALEERGFPYRRLTASTAVATCPSCGQVDALRVWYVASEGRTDLRCIREAHNDDGL